MFEDKRKILIISGLVALVVIIALIIWWFLQPKNEVINDNGQPDNNVINQLNPDLPAAPEPVSPQRAETEKNYPIGLKQLAMSFAERYGSYSSDEPQKNLTDLEPFMTESLKTSIKADSGLNSNGVFVGFSTKALASELMDLKTDSVKIIVQTQRNQTIGAVNQNVFYANLELLAVRVGNEWKINEVKWQ